MKHLKVRTLPVESRENIFESMSTQPQQIYFDTSTIEQFYNII